MKAQAPLAALFSFFRASPQLTERLEGAIDATNHAITKLKVNAREKRATYKFLRVFCLMDMVIVKKNYYEIQRRKHKNSIPLRHQQQQQN